MSLYKAKEEIERLKKEAVVQLELRAAIAQVILSDLNTQERIENLLEERVGLPGADPLTKKEEITYLDTIINDYVYRKVDAILEAKKEISDVLNDKKKNTTGFMKPSLMKIQSILLGSDKQDIKNEALKIKRGRGRALPKWLLSLKKGRYTVYDIVEISKTDPRNVQKIMKKYCKNVDYIDAGGHLKKCVYQWEGI